VIAGHVASPYTGRVDAKPFLVAVGRARASVVEVEGVSLRVASLADIIKSKRAAGRPRDWAVIELLEKALEAAQPQDPARRAPKGK